ncbi:hypothetical protein [Cellvibrio japonicus]|uniref:hypothetical protein n=1 Tax=Cellvibrio japonicus TaxID=155077 RepID=UPI000320B7B0|nr:hypothetical protein [Cellvibrio japonicus]QEI12151.1 hypothetical protein FY117_07890 [Cellvibrio japonicus]QEI15725.1 hypothetical protein FY116_07895 [Cellvibrio japonicus]QEI19303.1 hypothetical protein FY115_07890 [Cellvibrio japonicus]
MPNYSNSRLLMAALFSLFIVTALFHLVYPPPLDATTIRNGVTVHPAELPWSFKEAGQGNVLIARLSVTAMTPRTWHIIPDDHLRSISINNTPVDISSFGGAVRDYVRGFHIDLSPYFTNGQETVMTFVLDNGGGDGGLDVKPVISLWFWFAVTFAFLPFVIALSKAFRLLPEQFILLVLAFIPIAFYWADTPWMNRAYDVQGGSGHYEYIKYIATKLALPSPMEGWTYYHPPVYYVLGAFFWKWADWLQLPAPEFVRIYGLFLWFIFLAASAGAMRKVLGTRYSAIYVASAALFLWPGSIMHSVTIGNDIALYTCAGLVMWFMACWRENPRQSYLVWMGIFCGLALLCKSNGLPLIAACGLIIAMRMLPQSGVGFIKGFKETIIFSLLAGTGLVASFAVRIYFYLKGETSHWLISNAGGLHSGLKVPADLKAFIPLDIPTFITSPWMSAWEDATGRYNFWNYVLRSSLTGEFRFDGQFQTVMAYILGGILLIIFILFVIKMVIGIRVPVRQLKQGVGQGEIDTLPWLLFGLFWVLSLVALRIQLPYSCSNDFRYVLPVLVPFVIALALMGRWSRQLLVLFCIASLLFFGFL